MLLIMTCLYTTQKTFGNNCNFKYSDISLSEQPFGFTDYLSTKNSMNKFYQCAQTAYPQPQSVQSDLSYSIGTRLIQVCIYFIEPFLRSFLEKVAESQAHSWLMLSCRCSRKEDPFWQSFSYPADTDDCVYCVEVYVIKQTDYLGYHPEKCQVLATMCCFHFPL